MMHRDGSNQASQWLSVWTKSIRAKPVWAESIPTARHISHQPNDPSQNPLYGHWDSYAIISFVFALFLPVPVIPAVMGAIAMWRTKNCI